MLIRTKVQAPILPKKMLQRQNLMDKLSAGKDSRLTLISGPAGSGKTSLACQWIQQENPRVAWYGLDETDNEIDVFIRYLAHAFIEADSRLESGMGPLLQSKKTLSAKDTLPHFIHCLLDLTEDIYLVLDDFHLIDAGEVPDFLGHLFQFPPPKLHTVIISRHSLPEALSRFMVRGQTMEISASDLKFSEKETGAFFEEVMSINLPEERVFDLARRTEGWAAGLQMIGLSIQNKEHILNMGEILNRTYEQATDYLIPEVIRFQSEKIRHFLETTVLLDRFNVNLAKKVSGLEDSSEILDHLLRANLFLIPLDPDGGWYRYHHLFSETLRRRMEASFPEQVSSTRRDAALWLAKNDYPEDALRLASDSLDVALTVELLEDHMQHYLECNEYSLALRWILKLPPEILLERPLLRFHECLLKLELGWITDALAILADIKAHGPEPFQFYSDDKRRLCEDYLVYLKAITRYYSNPISIDLNQLQEMAQKISSENKYFSGEIRMTIVLSYLLQGNLPATREALKDASKIILSSDSMKQKILLFRTNVFVAMYGGFLHEAESLLDRASQYLEGSHQSKGPLKSFLYLPAAWIAYLRNDLDKALEYASTGLRYAELAEDIDINLLANTLMSYIHMAMSHRIDAVRFMQNNRAIAKRVGVPGVIAMTDVQAASLYMAQGDLGFAEKWAESRKVRPDEPFSLILKGECLTQAELFFRKGQYEEALRILKTLRTRCLKRDMMAVVLEIDIKRAAVHWAIDDQDKAKTAMEQALSFSEPEAYIRPFVDHAENISQLLIHMDEKGLPAHLSAHLKTIIHACGLFSEEDSASNRPEKNEKTYLTPREMEILDLMAKGHKNEEISQKAFIFINTVKAHTTHIFKKMGVKTRVQAILKAKELGLLDDA